MNENTPASPPAREVSVSQSQPGNNKSTCPAILWWLGIVLCGLLAFGGALRADFYMDDFGFILNFKGDAAASRMLNWPGGPYLMGTEGVDTFRVSVYQAIPTLLFMLSERMVPDVTEAAWLYHLWNLLLHLATACLAFYAGKRVLALAGICRSEKARDRAAWFGALLFACHPLASEPVYYAKCLNSITVAMFGLLLTGAMAEWLMTRRRRALVWAAAGLAGATFSYFPGMALAVLSVLLLAIFHASGEWRGILPRGFRWKSRAGAVVLAIGLAAGTAMLLRWLPVFAYQFRVKGDLYPDHIFTQGKLLWVYLAKAIVPVDLCSDHMLPWSRAWQDGWATAGLGGLILLLGGLFWTLFRSRGGRGWALLGLLALFPLLMRFAYVNAELLVEYRAYPILPWATLLLSAAALKLVEKRANSARPLAIGAGGVTAIFILLSVMRGQTWSDREALAEDSLERYPLNHRAMSQLQFHRAGNPEEVLVLGERILSAGAAIGQFARENPGRYYDDGRFRDSLFMSCQEVVYAIADMEGSAAGLKFAERSIAFLKEKLPDSFRGDSRGPSIAEAWPLLEARYTLLEHGKEIDAARAGRAAPPPLAPR
jgi:hypothetical protein